MSRFTRMWRLMAHPYLLLMLAALTWAGNAVAGRLIVGEASPMAVTCLRWLVVIALLGAVSGRRLLPELRVLAQHWRALFLMGAFGYTAFNAMFYAAAHFTSAINIGLIQGIVPALVVVGSFAVYGTPIGRAQLAGLGVALAGVAIAACRGDLDMLRRLAFNQGDLLMMIGCVLYAGFVLALRRRLPASHRAIFAGMACAAFLTSLPLLGLEFAYGAAQWPTPKGWAIITYIALVPSLVSQLFFLRGVELIGPARAGLFVNLVPVFAAILAVAILGEAFAPYHAVALGLVLAGIWLAESGRAAPA